MKTIPYEKFKHGQRVTCEIDGVKIDDAKISIDKDGEVFICQNKYDGNEPEDKLGYKYGWKITYKKVEFYDGKESVKNLQFPPRTIDDLEEGDVVVDTDGCEQKVLGICGKVYFLSCYDDFSKAGGDCYTLDELKKDSYTLKQEEEKLEFREPTEEEKKIACLTITKEIMGTLYINPYVTLSSQDIEKIEYRGKTYILSK